MRSVEWGLRALCAHLGILRVKTQKKHAGKVSYTPIEYTEWETMLNQVRSKVDKTIATLKRGKRKQLYQERYLPMIQEVNAIRDAWRNHVMHTRRDYSPVLAAE
jgi:hypothetical protein